MSKKVVEKPRVFVVSPEKKPRGFEFIMYLMVACVLTIAAFGAVSVLYKSPEPATSSPQVVLEQQQQPVAEQNPVEVPPVEIPKVEIPKIEGVLLEVPADSDMGMQSVLEGKTAVEINPEVIKISSAFGPISNSEAAQVVAQSVYNYRLLLNDNSTETANKRAQLAWELLQTTQVPANALPEDIEKAYKAKQMLDDFLSTLANAQLQQVYYPASEEQAKGVYAGLAQFGDYPVGGTTAKQLANEVWQDYTQKRDAFNEKYAEDENKALQDLSQELAKVQLPADSPESKELPYTEELINPAEGQQELPQQNQLPLPLNPPALAPALVPNMLQQAQAGTGNENNIDISNDANNPLPPVIASVFNSFKVFGFSYVPIEWILRNFLQKDPLWETPDVNGEWYVLQVVKTWALPLGKGLELRIDHVWLGQAPDMSGIDMDPYLPLTKRPSYGVDPMGRKWMIKPAIWFKQALEPGQKVSNQRLLDILLNAYRDK
jgi:hypothetical protein